MRPEKQNLTKEYLTRLNASPFFIVVDYKGLHVGHWTELRKRLVKAGAESFAYDKADEVANKLSERAFQAAGNFKSLRIIRKHAAPR